VRTLDDLNQNLIHEIEHFFVSYNAAKGKKFEPQGRFGPDQARQLVIETAERFRRET
jgi:inorganic pyrophosphatase